MEQPLQQFTTVTCTTKRAWDGAGPEAADNCSLYYYVGMGWCGTYIS